MNKTSTFFTWLAFCIFLPSLGGAGGGLYAQSWQWGARGGTSVNTATSDKEFVKDMATDRNGNIYVLANTGGSTNINIAGQTKTGIGHQDIIIASFRCNGSLRWVKIMGTSYFDDNGIALQTDKADGVYIAAGMFRGPDARAVYIDNDMTINDNLKKNLYFIKYDTSGNLKWVRAPQPDTVNGFSQAGVTDISVDDAGNMFALCFLPPGKYGGAPGFVAAPAYTAFGSPYADCMLKYDKNGNFLGGLNWDTKGCWEAGMIRDAKTGKFYLATTVGGNPLPVGITSVPAGNGFVACFDKDGKYLWDIHSNVTAITGRPVLDVTNNIYLGGTITPGTFNGFTAGPDAANNGSPFIVKLDSNKKNVWAKYALINSATYAIGVALRNSGEVVLSGFFPGKLLWPGYTKDTFNLQPNSGYHVYTTHFNCQTGKVLDMEKLETNNNDARSNIIIADGRNNVYVGGYFEGDMTVNGNTLHNIGGNNDWFVAKYGHNNCGCTNIPEPKFSFQRTGSTGGSFTYTGSAYNTIEWDFDDGNTSATANPTHVFDSNSVYTVCVKVTNACGDNTYCTTLLMWPEGVSELKAGDVRIYPNPVTDQLIVETPVMKEVTAHICNMQGQQLLQQELENGKAVIHTSSLSAGMYLLQLTDATGRRVIKTLVKE